MLRLLRIPFVVILSLSLSGCPAPRKPEAPPRPPVLRVEPGSKPMQILPARSLLEILVYRDGALASAGHNHVIASHEVTGTVYLHPDLEKSAFELHIPVGGFTVDEPELRKAEDSADFPAEVPESAREGTRGNMLGEALLDVVQYPEIRVISSAIRGATGRMAVGVHIFIKDHWRSMILPITVSVEGERVTATGEIMVSQSDLGLKPFSVMMGALKVKDLMTIKFKFVAGS